MGYNLIPKLVMLFSLRPVQTSTLCVITAVFTQPFASEARTVKVLGVLSSGVPESFPVVAFSVHHVGSVPLTTVY